MIKIIEAIATPKPYANSRGVRSTLTVLVPTDEQEYSENWKNSPEDGAVSWPFNGTEYVQFSVIMALLYSRQFVLGIQCFFEDVFPEIENGGIVGEVSTKHKYQGIGHDVLIDCKWFVIHFDVYIFHDIILFFVTMLLMYDMNSQGSSLETHVEMEQVLTRGV